MLKSIHYAYATSTIAAQLGRSRTGCYFIQTQKHENDNRPSIIPIAFVDLKECDRYAREIPFAWSRYSKRYCQQ